MKPTRRIGNVTSKTRAVIVDATGTVMLQQGYGAVTYRSIAAQAGVTAGLVQYYFPTLDDLFIALLRRNTDWILERLDHEMNADQPLRAIWDYASSPTATALLMEFMALANHRKAIRAVIGEGGERVRRAQLAVLESKWAGYGLAEDDLSPRALVFLMSCIPRMVHLEETFGTYTGHAETIGLVEQFLDRVEPRPASPTNAAADHADTVAPARTAAPTRSRRRPSGADAKRP